MFRGPWDAVAAKAERQGGGFVAFIPKWEDTFIPMAAKALPIESQSESIAVMPQPAVVVEDSGLSWLWIAAGVFTLGVVSGLFRR